MPKINKTSISHTVLYLLPILVILVWAVMFVFDSSFTVAGERVFCLFDDAMISLAYAQSLASGEGLAWGRQGLRVEGFSNPLWTFGMTLVELLPLKLEIRPLVVQIAGVFFLGLGAYGLGRLGRLMLSPRANGLGWLVGLGSVLVYPLWYWGLMGMETSLQFALLVLLVSLCIGNQSSPSSAKLLFVSGALLAATRMDMLLPIGVVASWLFYERRRREAGALLVGALFSLGAYQIFRLGYFGEWLPNTYYLKLTGFDLVSRLERGIALACTGWAVPAACVAGLVTGLSAMYLGLRDVVLLVALAGVQVAYSIYVGGDAWDREFLGVSRFMVVGLPFGILGVAVFVHRTLKRHHAWALVIALGLAGSLNGWLGDGGWKRTKDQLLFFEPPLLVVGNNLVYEQVRQLNERFEDHDILVSTCWAGIPAYYTDFRLLDCLGYNDYEIARLPVNTRPGTDGLRSLPGHNKSYPRLILDRHPDVIYQLWGVEERKILAQGYRKTPEGWFVRRGLLRRLKR